MSVLTLDDSRRVGPQVPRTCMPTPLASVLDQVIDSETALDDADPDMPPPRSPA